MTKTEYAAYLAGPDWRARAEQCKRDAGNQCERCEMPRWLAEIVYDQDLAAHHLSYARKGHEAPEDLEALCRRCHEIETFGRSELRKLKEATCSACFGTHWDYRSETCSACAGLLRSPSEVVHNYLRAGSKARYPVYGLDEGDFSSLAALLIESLTALVESLGNDHEKGARIAKEAGELAVTIAMERTKRREQDGDFNF